MTDEEFLKNIAEKIRIRRKEMGYTQEKLAEELGWERISIVRLEKGEHGSSILLYRNVARILNLDLCDLIAF